MRYSLLVILTLFALAAHANDISKINSLKKDAEKAFASQDYPKAILSYTQLLDSMNVEDDAARLNLAHAQFETQDGEGALKNYQKLVLSENEKIKSIAYQQLGNLSSDPKDLKKALSFFKESIKSDPTNEAARYNYEVVKKKLDQQQDQQDNQDQQDQENQDQENQDQENQDQQDQDQKGENEDQESESDQQNEDQQEGEQEESDEQKGDQENESQNEEGKDQDQEGESEQQSEEGEEQEQEDAQQQSEEQNQEGEEDQQSQSGEESEENPEGDEQQSLQQRTQEKLDEMNLSEEKAQMILEALKNSEIQYIQQNQRRATQKRDSDKPDW